MVRQAFDCWLVSLIPDSVDLRTACCFEGYETQQGGFRIELAGVEASDKGATIVEEARVLIGADGASSKVRKLIDGPSPVSDPYFAMQEWVETDDTQPYFSALFDPQITDYYCWTIPKGDQLLIGAALKPKVQTAEKFDLLKEKLTSLGFRVGKTIRREGAFLRRPRTTKDLSTGGQGIVLLGEAGDWISPSSAEGLSYAFRTALALAEALHPGLDGCQNRYHRNTRRLARNILLKNLKSRVIFSPALRSAAMRCGLQSVKVHRP